METSLAASGLHRVSAASVVAPKFILAPYAAAPVVAPGEGAGPGADRFQGRGPQRWQTGQWKLDRPDWTIRLIRPAQPSVGQATPSRS